MTRTNVRQSGGTGLPSTTGFPWMSVRVESVDRDIATVVDHLGVQRQISTKYRRGAGVVPRVGERWAIDRSLGFWTFATVLEAKPPTITGSHGNIPALINLLAELEKAGLIIDGTDASVLWSVHPHTHISADPGVPTSPDVLPPGP